MDTIDSSFLNVVGNRVRNLRAQRGLTRKQLARESSVSERYLAQLEQGRGNISILLLRQVANALQADPGELVASDDRQTAEQILINELIAELNTTQQREALQLLVDRYTRVGKSRIALIGLRGAGKSTLGQKLAEHHRFPFIRLVAEIEKLAGMRVSEIFSLSGQAGYRRMEEQALLETLRRTQACVIEAGGSIVSEPHVLHALLTACFVVWIKANPEEHMQRVIDQGDFRPMADNADAMSDLQQILAEREASYEQAHAVLDTSGRSVADCLAQLVELSGAAVAP